MEESKAIDPREACNAITRQAREEYDSMTAGDSSKSPTPAIATAVAVAFDVGCRACAEAACGRDVDAGALLSKIITVSALAEVISLATESDEQPERLFAVLREHVDKELSE